MRCRVLMKERELDAPPQSCLYHHHHHPLTVLLLPCLPAHPLSHLPGHPP